MKYFLGIDPGKSGAVAFLNQDGDFIAVYDCPIIETARFEILEQYFPRIVGAAVEKAQTMPTQGVVSSGKFMENYGIWKGICIASNIPFLTPHPKRWQKLLDGPTDMKPKDRVVEYVKRRWPAVELKRKKDHNRADAICLAEYARKEFMLRGDK